jgi:hypothetical protein
MAWHKDNFTFSVPCFMALSESGGGMNGELERIRQEVVVA